MIGFLPQPYLDELLYSVCARYSNQAQYPDKKSVVQELFGISTALAVIDLPAHLGNLIAALPLGHHYTLTV